ncbi:MAG: ABC transporter permease [Candidatus Thorarchaeota archaeon]|nr:ABC transporter permease [Candidatus Thorarchaeota archaeon]
MDENLYERVIKRRGWRSEIRAAWAMSIKTWKIELSYPLSILWFILMPFLWLIPLVLAGTSVSGGVDSSSLNNMTGISNWITYVAIGTALMGLIISIIWGTGMTLRREQNVGTLETLFTTPIGRTTFIWGNGLHNIQHGGLGVILQLVASVFIFGITIDAWGIFPALAIVALLVIGMQGIVYAVASIVLVAKQGWMLVEFVGSSLVLIAPLSYPLAVLPPVLQMAAMGSPLSWGADAFRNSLVFGLAAPGLVQSVVMLLLLDAIYLLVGGLLYKATDRWVRNRGALAQF